MVIFRLNESSLAASSTVTHKWDQGVLLDKNKSILVDGSFVAMRS